MAVDRGLTNMSAWEFAYTSPRSGNIQTNIIEDYLNEEPWSNLDELYFDIYQNVTMEDMLGRLLNDTSIAAASTALVRCNATRCMEKNAVDVVHYAGLCL